jgi:hypothetical protein
MSDDLRAQAIDIRRGICSDPGVCVERNYLGCECVADIETALRAAVETEREALAVLVEQAGEKMWSTGHSRNHVELAAAIRARRL